jgi:hypothetical protein
VKRQVVAFLSCSCLSMSLITSEKQQAVVRECQGHPGGASLGVGNHFPPLLRPAQGEGSAIWLSTSEGEQHVWSRDCFTAVYIPRPIAATQHAIGMPFW